MRKRTLLLVLILGFGLALFAWQQAEYQREAEVIKARHRQIIKAFASNDSQAIEPFIAPEQYRHARGNLAWIKAYGSTPDNDAWSVVIRGDQATVIPRRVFHFYLIPGGSGFEMIKVDNEWYLTGKISID